MTTTGISFHRCTLPRSPDMLIVVPKRVCAAILPRQQIIRGRTAAICASRYGRHAAISSGWGSLFWGGRHFTQLAMKHCARVSPMGGSHVSRYWPAAPTKGRPEASSSAPGPSPMKRTGGSRGPSPGTVMVRLSESPHFTHAVISDAIAAREPARSAGWMPVGAMRPAGRAGAAMVSSISRSGCSRENPVASQSSSRYSFFHKAFGVFGVIDNPF